jgi:hypothetical protein
MMQLLQKLNALEAFIVHLLLKYTSVQKATFADQKAQNQHVARA